MTITTDPSDRADPGTEELPDRLRVHSLARALGTTSKRVLDALSELDGRIRSAHSSVDRTTRSGCAICCCRAAR